MTGDWLQLRSKVCVITGATGGIGRGLVAEFAAQGARLALLDRDLAQVQALAAEAGTEAIGLACDVTSEDSVVAVAKQVEAAFGGCDILINNAGVIQPKALLDASLADWQAGTAVNLDGYFLCARVFGAQMITRGGGAIVHIGSIASELPQPNGLGYSAAKSATNSLSRQIALEWGPQGIRSNVVNPGMVLTPMTAKLNADPEILKKRAALTTVRRLGSPQDIANIAAFLASDRAGYVNGADLMATGGTHVMMMQMIPQPGLKPAAVAETKGAA